MRIGKRELLFLTLLGAMPVLAWFFVFQPRTHDIDQALQQIEQKEQRLDELQRATRDIDSLGNEIDRLAQAIEMFEQKLPVEREVEVILREVWQLAGRHGLNPSSVRTDNVVPAAHYAELPIHMAIEGNFDGFYQFLLDLEELPRITRMPRMRIEHVDADEDGNMRANVVLSIFFDRPDNDDTLSRGGPGR